MDSTDTQVDNRHRDAHWPIPSSLNVPPRVLLGPGPSNCAPATLQSMAMTPVGYADPFFYSVMDELQTLMRYMFQTNNTFTLPICGPGSAAMECAVANLVELGDTTVNCVAGYFAQRMADITRRVGGNVHLVTAPWGQCISFAAIKEAVEKHKPKVLFVTQGETSTGLLQPLGGLGELCAQYGTIFVVDGVASIGGVPFFADKWGVDVAFTGGQKALSGPAGIAPLTMSERALAVVRSRTRPVPNWCLDVIGLSEQWCPTGNNTRKYYTTPACTLIYGLRESLRQLADEGLLKVWKRHRAMAQQLWDGLHGLGLECLVEQSRRLPTLTTVCVPKDRISNEIRMYLLQNFNIEIAEGIGQLSGKIWRIGLMGYNSRSETVKLVLGALQEALSKQRSKL